MHPEMFFVMVGGIIVAGFLGNLLFRFAKIPSVLLLMVIGILLGPVFHIVQSDLLFDFAPYFGTVALIIILFEGGLDLEIETVVRQFGKAILLTILVFLLTFVAVTAIGSLVIGLPLLQSLMLGAIVGGTSPAIIIPVVSKLNVRNHVKTLLSLEPALADVLIIVAVVICIGIFQTQSADPVGIVVDIVQSFTVAIGIAVVMGVVWARFIASLSGESLSYMLTLGFLFLLYFIVEHFKGSGAIAVLFFGVVLANMGTIAQRFRGPLHKLLGIRVDAAKYALDAFVHNITIELSFLVRTFFFVFLGLLFSFDTLTSTVGLHIAVIVGACLLARFVGAQTFLTLNKKEYSPGERLTVHAMAPRGLATAAMAFAPINAAVPSTELFPMYALAVIGLTSLSMTGMVAVAARKTLLPVQESSEASEEGETATDADSSNAHMAMPTTAEVEQEEELIAESKADIRQPSEPEDPRTFRERLVAWLFISEFRFRELDHFAVRSTGIFDLLYWLQTFGAAAVAALGIVMDNAIIIFAGMLFAPVAAVINTASVSLTTGDIYIFLKSVLKFLLTCAAVVLTSAIVALLVPFAGVPGVVAQQTQPTVLDFALALIVGVLLPVAILRGRSLEIFSIAPIAAFLVLPPLAIVGYGLGSDSSTMQIISGGLLSFSAHITALLISSVLTLLAFGVTRHSAITFVEEWKQRELSGGFMRALLTKKYIARLLQTTGTVRSRLVVLMVFSLVLFIPLVTSINEVSQGYKVRQAVMRHSKIFEQNSRSSILSVDVDFNNRLVATRIRVATNTFYTDADIEQFENTVEKELGFPTKLTLVQSYGDIGAARKMAALSSTRAEPETFRQRLSYLAGDAKKAVASVPNLVGINILGASVQFPHNAPPQVLVEYLAFDEVDSNLALMLRSRIAENLGISEREVIVSWVPSEYSGNSIELTELTGPGGRMNAAEVIDRFGNLSGTILLPKRARRDSMLPRVVEQLRSQRAVLGDTVRFQYTQGESEMLRIRFR